MLLISKELRFLAWTPGNSFMEEIPLAGAINFISKRPSGEGISAKLTVRKLWPKAK